MEERERKEGSRGRSQRGRMEKREREWGGSRECEQVSEVAEQKKGARKNRRERGSKGKVGWKRERMKGMSRSVWERARERGERRSLGSSILISLLRISFDRNYSEMVINLVEVIRNRNYSKRSDIARDCAVWNGSRRISNQCQEGPGKRNKKGKDNTCPLCRMLSHCLDRSIFVSSLFFVCKNKFVEIIPKCLHRKSSSKLFEIEVIRDWN